MTGDKEDSRCLHISLHKPASSHLAKPIPLLTAKFIFDDHIRCMAAKQRLTKGRSKARQVCVRDQSISHFCGIEADTLV